MELQLSGPGIYNMLTSKFSLLTDFYELTMMAGYYRFLRERKAIFEMFFRRAPFKGGYAIFAGLAPLLEILSNLKFNEDEINYLASLNIFEDEFIDFLSSFRFSGVIYAVPEGSVVFPDEPLIRVEGNLLETQYIESMLLNCINFQTLIATKAGRVSEAARGKPILEFGLRRAQGFDGALSATRASIIGGVSSTSNTHAGKVLNVPVKGTMAHSWIMSFQNELEAFRSYAKLYPDNCILLVDTYDTLKSGIPNAIQIFTEMNHFEGQTLGIRLDSGDPEYLSFEGRRMLDEAGLQNVKIFVSNELDEWIIHQLTNSEAPIDAYGVGTKLVTAEGDPSLTGVYKIVSRDTGSDLEPCIKISNESEKTTNPGRKNILRFFKNNEMQADLIILEEELEDLQNKTSKGKPVRFNHPTVEVSGFTMKSYDRVEVLQEKVMENGVRPSGEYSLEELSKRRENGLKQLDRTYKRLISPHTYKISLSDRLRKLKSDLIHQSMKGKNSNLK
jgi:nicotinate phosphoribosyltransferase